MSKQCQKSELGIAFFTDALSRVRACAPLTLLYPFLVWQLCGIEPIDQTVTCTFPLPRECLILEFVTRSTRTYAEARQIPAHSVSPRRQSLWYPWLGQAMVLCPRTSSCAGFDKGAASTPAMSNIGAAACRRHRIEYPAGVASGGMDCAFVGCGGIAACTTETMVGVSRSSRRQVSKFNNQCVMTATIIMSLLKKHIKTCRRGVNLKKTINSLTVLC